MKLMDQELIRVLSLDTPVGKYCFWKVPEIECNNKIGATLDGRRQHMAIVLVRQFDDSNEILIIFNQGVTDMKIHQLAGSLKLSPREIGTVPKEVVNPLVEDRI